VSSQPDDGTHTQQQANVRVSLALSDWHRAGHVVYDLERAGDHPIRPSDIIRTAEGDTK